MTRKPYEVYSDVSLTASTSAQLASTPMIEREKGMSPPAAEAEAVRLKRLREDARRPLSVNLAEGIALSHKLMRFTGAARKVDGTGV